MTNQIADSQILAWMSAKHRTQSGYTAFELAKVVFNEDIPSQGSMAEIRVRMKRLETQGKVERDRRGTTDLWYVKSACENCGKPCLPDHIYCEKCEQCALKVKDTMR